MPNIFLEVTQGQLDTIIEALEEFIDNEESFLMGEIKDDPDDLATIIHASVNIQNARDLRSVTSKAKEKF